MNWQRMGLKGLGVLAWVVAAGVGQAEVLPLEGALAMAKERNGDIIAAQYQLQSAKSGVRQALAGFSPTITPNYQYSTTRLDQHTGTPGSFNATGSTMDVTARYRVWDNGERRLNVSSSQASLRVQEHTALNTLRQTLLSVITRYYDALRAQELLRVQEAQLERAKVILRQTEARIAAEDLPGKDLYQPLADKANAEVAVLGAQIRVRTTLASLKAVVGWRAQDGTLELADRSAPENLKPIEWTFEQALERGLKQRPDLNAQRAQLSSQRVGVRLAAIDAGLQYSIDATYTRSFARDVFDRSGVGLVASFPLWDGGSSKEAVKARKSQLAASESQLLQNERDVTAEIESVYNEFSQNLARLVAAEAARTAARKNYDFVIAANKEQVATLPEVINAQASLVTAEVNYVEAYYDALLSSARFEVAIGQPVWGEGG